MFYIKTHIGLGHVPLRGEILWSWDIKQSSVNTRWCQQRQGGNLLHEASSWEEMNHAKHWLIYQELFSLRIFIIRPLKRIFFKKKILHNSKVYSSAHLCRDSRSGWWRARSIRACCAPARCSRNAHSPRSCSSSPRPCSEHIFMKHFNFKYCQTQFC